MESMDSYDVVITTYSTLVREWQKNGHQAAIIMKQWYRVILDEGVWCLNL